MDALDGRAHFRDALDQYPHRPAALCRRNDRSCVLSRSFSKPECWPSCTTPLGRSCRQRRALDASGHMSTERLLRVPGLKFARGCVDRPTIPVDSAAARLRVRCARSYACLGRGARARLRTACVRRRAANLCAPPLFAAGRWLLSGPAVPMQRARDPPGMYTALGGAKGQGSGGRSVLQATAVSISEARIKHKCVKTILTHRNPHISHVHLTQCLPARRRSSTQGGARGPRRDARRVLSVETYACV